MALSQDLTGVASMFEPSTLLSTFAYNLMVPSSPRSGACSQTICFTMKDGTNTSKENTPSALGLTMKSKSLLSETPKPTDEDIDAAMDGNLCRCASYARIRKAIHRAAELMEAAAPMAGEFFNFHCPVAAEAQIGNNWAETH